MNSPSVFFIEQQILLIAYKVFFPHSKRSAIYRIGIAQHTQNHLLRLIIMLRCAYIFFTEACKHIIFCKLPKPIECTGEQNRFFLLSFILCARVHLTKSSCMSNIYHSTAAVVAAAWHQKHFQVYFSQHDK